MTPARITSPANQTIKDMVRLKDRKGERAATSFVVEGAREIERAIASGFKLLEVFVCDDDSKFTGGSLSQNTRGAKTTIVSGPVFAKLAMRETSDGVLAVFEAKTRSVDTLRPKNPGKGWLILAVENIEKPGNLGALLRTADAASVDAIIVIGHKIDPWNQNCIRSSLGGVFSVPVVPMTREDFFEWCAREKIRTVAAALSERSQNVFEMSMTGSVAIALGSEAMGLSLEFQRQCDHLAVIPMRGVCDSLNVSVAGAVFIFEILRQRDSRG
jgi:TrmH family RNA methyltransferase